MNLTNLYQFNKFDWDAFSKDKEFTMTSCKEWKDFNDGSHMGTDVRVRITKDDTAYYSKDGETVTNLYEELSFKVSNDVQIPVDSKVVPVNPVVSAYEKKQNNGWSNYKNQLSVKCDDIKII